MLLDEYGPPEVLRLKEVQTPVPGNGELLVRVRACPVDFGDVAARDMRRVTPSTFTMPLPLWLPVRLMFGFRRPRRRILGSGFSGDVVDVGPGVTAFRGGDPVFGYLGPRLGGNAEYLRVAEHGVVAPKPDNVTYEQAAAVPYGALTALGVLRAANIRPGERVLVIGASGAIGSAAVQLARLHFGATVSGVCSSAGVELVRSLGADEVLDYTREDFTRNGRRYDVIVDVPGVTTYARCRSSLAANGRYLAASFTTRQLAQMVWTRIFGGTRVICAIAPGSVADLRFVGELVAAGRLRAVIDRSFPLEQTPDAHRYLEQNTRRGHVVIRQ